MEQAVIIAIVIAVAALIIIITSCCCCCNSRKKKEEKNKKKQIVIAKETKDTIEVSIDEAQKKPVKLKTSEGTSNQAYQESKPTDTTDFNEIKKAADELTVQPPNDGQSWERVDINYNPAVDSSVNVEVDKGTHWPVQNQEEIRKLQQRQDIDLGDPSPVYTGNTSLSSISDKAGDSLRLHRTKQDLQRDSLQDDFKSGSFKSSPFVAPYSKEVRDELGSFIRMSSIDRHGLDSPGQNRPKPMHSLPESPAQRLPRPPSTQQQSNSEDMISTRYPEHQKQKNSFRIETDVPVQLHVPVEHRREKISRLPSIPQPDYLEETKVPPKIPPKPSDVRRRELTSERESLKEPVSLKPSAIKRREFKGPYGPEDLDDENNPYTIARGKAKRHPLSHELE